jgi:hypothetical protein
MPRGLRIGHPRHYTATLVPGVYTVAGQDVTLTYAPAADTTPNQFTFVDQTGAGLSSTVTSAAVTITGITAPITLNASGGTIDLNGNGVFLGSQIVSNGDTVRARVTSSGSNSTAVNCTVVASPSGVQDTFTVTTVSSGAFSPLQRFTADSMTTGVVPSGSGIAFSKYGNGYGTVVQTAVKRATKSKAIACSIQAGTSGFPGDSETPAANGFWGFSFTPPSSTGSSHYGIQGDWLHFGFWFYLPTGVTLNTTSLQDGAQKFILLCFPQAVTTGKYDTHICSQTGSVAGVSELDGGAMNNYPSDVTGTDVPWPRDQWMWCERGIFIHSDPLQAIDRFWVNDDLWFERNGVNIKRRLSNGTYATKVLANGSKSLPNSSTYAESLFWFSYWNAHPAVDTTVYCDGFTFANNRTGFVSDSFGNLMMGTANAG